jgi:hypothetical protein
MKIRYKNTSIPKYEIKFGYHMKYKYKIIETISEYYYMVNIGKLFPK